MFNISSYYSFLLAIIVFQLFPGAGTIAILKATASHGIRSGMSAVLGTLAGDVIYMTAAVLGVAAMMQKFPVALEFAQYTGALYLCYLGVMKFFENVDNGPHDQGNKTNDLHLFREALAICLTNPKAVMFFMAFFPLFLTQNSGPITLVVMMLHVTTISLVYQTLLVILGNSICRYISGWKYARKVATRLTGAAFIGFGIKLARNINN